MENETVWLTQAQMAELFDVKENTITYHIKEIYKCNELDADSTARKIQVVRKEGTRNVNRQIDFYNLDMIISIGYRVNSVRGTLLLLDKRAAEVECTVYTRYSEQTELDFQKHNQQCAPIRKIQLSQAVHDRYLIVDNQVWLLGASVKDMGRGLCTVIRLGFTPEDVLKRM